MRPTSRRAGAGGRPDMMANFAAIAVLRADRRGGERRRGGVQMNLRTLMSKRARLMGTLLRARPIEQKADAVLAFGRQVVPQLEAGPLRADDRRTSTSPSRARLQPARRLRQVREGPRQGGVNKRGQAPLFTAIRARRAMMTRRRGSAAGTRIRPIPACDHSSSRPRAGGAPELLDARAQEVAGVDPARPASRPTVGKPARVHSFHAGYAGPEGTPKSSEAITPPGRIARPSSARVAAGSST